MDQRKALQTISDYMGSNDILHMASKKEEAVEANNC